MKQADTEDLVLPYPKSRRFLEAAMRSTHDKPMIHGLLENRDIRHLALSSSEHD